MPNKIFYIEEWTITDKLLFRLIYPFVYEPSNRSRGYYPNKIPSVSNIPLSLPSPASQPSACVYGSLINMYLCVDVPGASRRCIPAQRPGGKIERCGRERARASGKAARSKGIYRGVYVRRSIFRTLCFISQYKGNIKVDINRNNNFPVLSTSQ